MKPTILFPSGPALSWEILDRFLSYLPLSDLAEASVLNHTWQTAVFPHLYHTLRIGYAERLEQIARRAASDDGRGPLSISAHVKGLVLRQAYSNYKLKSITQDHLNHLKLLIPRLKKLQSLSWELYLLADDMEIMPMFQTHCPNLKSFHVNIDQDNFFYHTVLYPSLFNFKDLANISINIVDRPVIFDDETCVKPLTDMLTSSQNLVSLSFELGRSPYMQLHEPTSTFSPNLVISSLGAKFRFPHLRTLHLRGRLNPDWPGFVEDVRSRSHPLRAFLARHPTIEDLALGWFRGDGQYFEVQPKAIVSLLPSLKHFEGPAFLCGSIVKSNLARQLESLTVVDQTFYRFPHAVYADTMTKASDGITKLPELRYLAVWATTPIYGWVLERFIKASSKLRELELRMKVDCESVVSIVSRARNLHKLTVSCDVMCSARYYPDGSDFEDEYSSDDEGGLEAFIEGLANESKRLKEINVYGGWWGGDGWKIKRQGGEAKVSFVG